MFMLESQNHDSPLREHWWTDDFTNICVTEADLQHQNEPFPITNISKSAISSIQDGQEEQSVITFDQLCFVTDQCQKQEPVSGWKGWKRSSSVLAQTTLLRTFNVLWERELKHSYLPASLTTSFKGKVRKGWERVFESMKRKSLDKSVHISTLRTRRWF